MSIARRFTGSSFECLERRRLLAGDTDCLSDAVECGHHDVNDGCELADEHGIELTARLAGSGREQGEAELEVESDDDGLEIEFEVEVEKAVPGSVHNVMLDGVVVGHITVDAHGEGRLRLGNQGEADEQPLPPDFPNAGLGSEVKVGAIVAGTLGGEQTHDDRNYEEECSQEIRFSAALSGRGREHGEVEFEMEDDDDQLELELEVEVEKAVPGSVHDVAIDGVTVAQITIGDDGRGRIRMATHQEEAGDLPIPDNFPANVGADSVVTVGTILSGTFSMHGDLNQNQTGDSAQDVIDTVVGDANMDGVFDSSDLVQVFRAGQYEDAVLQNSIWQTGDWNGDGEFDSSDLVLAFRSGGYSAAAQ